MQNRIENLQKNIGKTLQACLARQDFQSVTHISPLLARVQDLQKRTQQLDGEISEVESAVQSLNSNPAPEKTAQIAAAALPLAEEDLASGRAGPQTLKIQVNWQTLGKGTETEVICLPTAAETMTEFLAKLVERCGRDVLEKMTTFKINRGPLVSRSPATDFVNQTKGNLYAHKKVRATDAFALTHSSTPQKIEDLQKLCRVLRFVP